MDEMRKLVNLFEEYNCPLSLMHTVSAYPAKDKDLNLNCINITKDLIYLLVTVVMRSQLHHQYLLPC